MKQAFNKHWKSSKQPRKQRKCLANAPLHIGRNMLASKLSKELRKKHGIKSLPVKNGDKVKVLRGGFKGKEGSVSAVDRKEGNVTVDGLQAKKQDGSNVNVPIKTSNLQITELNLDDKKRSKTLKAQEGKEKQESKEKKEDKTSGEKSSEKNSSNESKTKSKSSKKSSSIKQDKNQK